MGRAKAMQTGRDYSRNIRSFVALTSGQSTLLGQVRAGRRQYSSRFALSHRGGRSHAAAGMVRGKVREMPQLVGQIPALSDWMQAMGLVYGVVGKELHGLKELAWILVC